LDLGRDGQVHALVLEPTNASIGTATVLGGGSEKHFKQKNDPCQNHDRRSVLAMTHHNTKRRNGVEIHRIGEDNRVRGS
jgi:hypothetical protein